MHMACRTYMVSFFCYYDGNCTRHYRTLRMSEIPKWIAAYEYTHPNVKAITAMIKKTRQ